VKLLALDTATENCSAALWIGDRLTTRAQLLGRGHGAAILPMVDDLLRSARLKLNALDAIAFGRGPGAFTGVRLAASVTQGLAFGAGLPVVPVSDLQALAQRAIAQYSCQHVLACLDARMHEVYWARFARTEAGLASPLGPERVGPPDSVAPESLVAPPSGSSSEAALCGAGPGFAAYPLLGQRVAALSGHVHDDLFPRAEEIIRLAIPEVEAGRVFPPEQALPLYLRDDVTQSPGPRH
jgi:tRNA threonylcarbamoyladenosine biosynthesis protein TsaB